MTSKGKDGRWAKVLEKHELKSNERGKLYLICPEDISDEFYIIKKKLELIHEEVDKVLKFVSVIRFEKGEK